MMVALLTLLAALAASGPPPAVAAVRPTCQLEGLDSDGDRLTDACEIGLLKRFAPALVASGSACNWDPASGRLRGGYLVGAGPIPGGVRLAYLPAYFEDCGWSGAKCLLRLRGGCDPHAGDSEAIFIDVEGSAAVVWVAAGKNANYPSKSSCDSGHWHLDTCDQNARAFRFPVESPLQDIGSAAHPFPHGTHINGCVDGLGLFSPSGLVGTECPWSSEWFRMVRFGGRRSDRVPQVPRGGCGVCSRRGHLRNLAGS